MKPMMVLYVPVVHAGYLRLFKKYQDRVEMLAILGTELIEEFMPLHKEIRALEPEVIAQMVAVLGIFRNGVVVLNRGLIRSIRASQIITANDSVSCQAVQKYLPDSSVIVETAFLRWDEQNVFSQMSTNHDRESTGEFDRQMIERAVEKSKGSADWWRHVGALVVKNGEVLFEACNQHVPYEQVPYIDGDPRDFIEAGELSHFSTAMHSEASVIAAAAKAGVSLQGADLYVTVFPCPACAKLIAHSGIKRCFFASGHASLDGETILKAKGVELIFVNLSSS